MKMRASDVPDDMSKNARNTNLIGLLIVLISTNDPLLVPLKWLIGRQTPLKVAIEIVFGNTIWRKLRLTLVAILFHQIEPKMDRL
jgi:hypothetical protein